MSAPFRPSDEDIRAYLEGEHGPPSSEAVRIIQAELEHAARTAVSACALCLTDLPADDMCRHARWLCWTCCIDHCDPEDER